MFGRTIKRLQDKSSSGTPGAGLSISHILLAFFVIFKQATLKVRGKALSAEQKSKVVTKTQTENPLYLKTLLEVIECFIFFYLHPCEY